MTIHVVEGFSGYLHEWLVNGRADLAILHNPSHSPELVIKPLIIEEMHLISTADRAEAMQDNYRLYDAAMLPLILPRRPHSLRSLIESTFAGQRLPTSRSSRWTATRP